MAYDYFQRSPRLKRTLPKQTVEIHRPPLVPQPPAFSIISILIPIIITGISLFAYLYIGSRMNTGNKNFFVFQMIFMSAMIVSYTVPVFTYLYNKRNYRRQVETRTNQYQEVLEKHRRELIELQEEQRSIMHELNPSVRKCIQRIEERSSSLWERSTRDEDFLRLRMGEGTLPATYQIIVPKQEGYETDPLVEEAQNLSRTFGRVESVPIQLPLFQSKVIGVVGEQEAVLNAIRVMVLQMVTHHSPDEVKIATFYPEWEEEQWKWLRWLPHTWNDEQTLRFVAQEKGNAHQLLDFLYSQLNRRKMTRATDFRKAVELPCWVFILSAPHLIEDEPILPLLLKEAEAIGACTILLADSKDSLPMQCQLIVEVQGDRGTCKETVTGDATGIGDGEIAFTVDTLSLDTVEHAARMMASLKVKRSTAAEIPQLLPLFDLLGIEKIEDLDVAALWRGNRFPESLPVPVGVRTGGKKILLNLHDKIERRGHGPHGLIAGTTGSGKSEVIQSIVASLAVHYHPHEMAFLLIDYKGGGMSNTFRDLPHVVGSITNLDDRLLERAMVSLRAELIRRQKILNEAGDLQHIDEYYETAWRTTHPLPHLVIIIDEFAQLKKEHPEFMNELISIATIGRTLGVHLILATQKPGGVVDDKIWSNARFRICLRVQDDADSREMLKIPDAAWITTPGRGYLQVGSNEEFDLLQFAWSGAPYHADQKRNENELEIYAISLSGKRTKCEIQENVNINRTRKQKKQLQVLMEYLAGIAEQEGISRLPGPWLPPLPQQLSLEDISDCTYGWNGREWVAGVPNLSAIVGLVDDLANQRQEPLLVSLEDGHLPIYGMPGTGKTTFLQTFLFSLTTRHSPEHLHLYLLDFGRTLRDFSYLPHVGSVILDNESDKIKRLFHYLLQEVSRRRELLANSGVKTLRAYQMSTGITVPRIVVCIDGYLNFRNQYAYENDQLEQLLREGGSVGLSFVVTANRITDILEKIRSNFSLGVAFELSDPSDYYFAVGRPTKPPVHLSAGRGLVKGQLPPLEFQTAFPIAGEDDMQRSVRLRNVMEQMSIAWKGERPKEIVSLPEVVLLEELFDIEPVTSNKSSISTIPDITISSPSRSLRVPVGIYVDDLTPFEVDLKEGPFFVVGSPMEGGKTSFLMTWVLSLCHQVSPQDLEIYFIDYRASSMNLMSLNNLPHIQGRATRESELGELLTTLSAKIKMRQHHGEHLKNQSPVREQQISNQMWKDELLKQVESSKTVEALQLSNDKEPALLLVIDDADLFFKETTDYQIKDQLAQLVRQGRNRDLYVIISGVPADFPFSSNDWLSEIKNMQTGFLFGSIDASDLAFFKIPSTEASHYPHATFNKMLPPGQGYFAKRRYHRVKAAVPFDEERSLQDFIVTINQKWLRENVCRPRDLYNNIYS
ncbi:type VII secretion protein EssC [Brevibacillus laterosporus]|uniref:type VII secretion protein EssC n=1 Tax=Brevibacillus laterosporus TaxID=1465 RepID=UPI00215C64F9|nr:type VII secretion protein EssC [Brevibacillus laterosporus]MCR8935855.1 type VII secretion protein EssC [Brevibacillus laterosporus]MCZ0838494.1 type VII secretion protein EssC [Brevibacillus laterosporus]MCZ0844434.1 type VII secretion protein EssC [Brevibacillus laterosporus]